MSYSLMGKIQIRQGLSSGQVVKSVITQDKVRSGLVGSIGVKWLTKFK